MNYVYVILFFCSPMSLLFHNYEHCAHLYPSIVYLDLFCSHNPHSFHPIIHHSHILCLFGYSFLFRKFVGFYLEETTQGHSCIFMCSRQWLSLLSFVILGNPLPYFTSL